MSFNVGVIGASGYAGGELLRLLHVHPEFNLTYISAGSNAGEFISSVHPSLTSFGDQKFEETIVARANTCELLFIALPHGESAKFVHQIKEEIKIVDLGADFRLESSASWKSYYGGEYAGSWTYGSAELAGCAQKISESIRVANPGCYATAIELASAPLFGLDGVDTSDLVVVAASGTTGAGRAAKVNLIGSEVMNTLTSYKFGGVHQHTPEVEESLFRVSGKKTTLSFTPILAPMPRGILATVSAKNTNSLDLPTLREKYIQYFAHSSFVHLLPEGQMPTTSAVTGTNDAHIQVAIDSHANRVVISIAIDNLGKGAAAQAIHNANLMCGLPPVSGLQMSGVR